MSPFNAEGHAGMAAPPEGVLVGEDVPRENEWDDLFAATVDQVAAWLKAHPAYRERSESELRELAMSYIDRSQTERSSGGLERNRRE